MAGGAVPVVLVPAERHLAGPRHQRRALPPAHASAVRGGAASLLGAHAAGGAGVCVREQELWWNIKHQR
jgi:hypothetical protein